MHAGRRFWSVLGVAVVFALPTVSGFALANQATETVISEWLKPSSELRVLLGDGVTIKVDAGRYLDKPFGLSLIPFKDGEPLKAEAECTYEEPASFEIEEGLSPDMIVARAGDEGGAFLKLTIEGEQRTVLGTLSEYYSVGAKRWTINEPYGDIFIHVTAELAENAPIRNTRVNFRGTSNPGGVRGEIRSEMTLVDGESESLRFPQDDRVSEIGFTVNSGRARILYMVDYREGSRESPPFPDKQGR